MSNFQELSYLGVPETIFDWFPRQPLNYSITTTPDRPTSTTHGNGSILDIMRFDEEFTQIATPWNGTVFEDVVNEIRIYFSIGRVRIMSLEPKTCLSWHRDDTIRLHLPLQTNENCFMVIDKEVKHLEQGKWYLTNTLKHHTVFNGNKEFTRYHLVINLLLDNDISFGD